MSAFVGDSGNGNLYVFPDLDGDYDIPRDLIRSHERAIRQLQEVERAIFRRLGYSDVRELVKARAK